MSYYWNEFKIKKENKHKTCKTLKNKTNFKLERKKMCVQILSSIVNKLITKVLQYLLQALLRIKSSENAVVMWLSLNIS